ncbi:unnamed protein product [Calypogeia fissa]
MYLSVLARLVGDRIVEVEAPGRIPLGAARRLPGDKEQSTRPSSCESLGVSTQTAPRLKWKQRSFDEA